MPVFSLLPGLPAWRGRLAVRLLGLALLLLVAPPAPTPAASGKIPELDHPIVTPHLYTKHKRCLNCGMKLNMWARTRHSFTLTTGEYQVCSIHCVAEISLQNKEVPKNVMVALYLEPETMLPAEEASYVVGSTARGTMTAVSKIAFASPQAAQSFAAEYGGAVMSFAEALAKARAEL